MLLLATRWWVSDGSDDYFAQVEHLLQSEPARVPELLQAMVQTGEPGTLKKIGTGPIESLQMGIEFGYREEPSTLDLLIAAELTPAQLREVLSGVYVDILDEMDARHRLEAFLPAIDLEWLLDNEAPGRRDHF